MVMPKGKLLDKYEPHSLNECFDIPYKPIQMAAQKFMTGDEYTVNVLADLLNMSLTSTREQIYYLMKHKLIYVSRWFKTKSNNWTALYKAGNAENAPAPGGVSMFSTKRVEQPKQDDIKPPSHFDELARALVPVRDEAGRREINWQYWKYISGEAA